MPGRERVTVLDPALSRGEQHVALTAGGPWDRIVDRLGPGPGMVARVLDSLYQLRDGGVLVVEGSAAHKRMRRFLAAVDPMEEPASLVGVPDGDLAAARSALSSVEVTGPDAVLTRRALPAYAKLSDDELAELTHRRPELGLRVLEEVPGLRFASRCEAHSNVEQPRSHTPTEYDAPPLCLREYRDVLVLPGQLVVKEDPPLVLPDSFRRNLRKRLRSSYTDDLAPLFAVPHEPVDDAPVLPGTYFHVDSEARGHFGHVVTEVVARLWGWERARAVDPGVKALTALNKGRELAGWERSLFAAAGIGDDDLVFTRSPVRVERLITARPAFSHPDYVHPLVQETWTRMGDALAAQATLDTTQDRVFLTRAPGALRDCHNREEVEAVFAAHGFEVLRPETLPLPDQVALLRRARVVAGFAGSQLFTLCFAPGTKHVVRLCPETYWAANEYLIGAVQGHTLHTVVSKADRPDAFHSGFTFDHGREGRYLEQVLGGL